MMERLKACILEISLGDKVRYRFAALPEREYGIFEGNITLIPGDVTSNGANGNVYVLEGSVDTNRVENSKGISVLLKSGMFCDARIITRKQKILDYLLEKLDFKS